VAEVAYPVLVVTVEAAQDRLMAQPIRVAGEAEQTLAELLLVMADQVSLSLRLRDLTHLSMGKQQSLGLLRELTLRVGLRILSTLLIQVRVLRWQLLGSLMYLLLVVVGRVQPSLARVARVVIWNYQTRILVLRRTRKQSARVVQGRQRIIYAGLWE
jgi:hypothetical protein